jgi:hypothetical protein
LSVNEDLQKERFIARIENIKEHVPLAKVAVDLGVVPADLVVGGEFQLKCPFHGKDSKPSAHVYADGLFHCFTCKRHYNVIHFVSNYKGMSFIDACRFLETAYSVPKLDFINDTIRNELYDSLKANKNGVEKKEYEAPFEERFKQLELKIIKNKRQLGLETYAKALLGLDLTKEAKQNDQLTALEQKIDARLQAV